MGISFAEVVGELRRLDEESPEAEKYADAVLVTNQDNGIVSYARGRLAYRRGLSDEAGSLATPPYGAWGYLFSDRALRVSDPGFLPGTHGVQPFAVTAADSIGVRLDWSTTQAARLSVTLFSWGGGTFAVDLAPVGNLLCGVGTPVGCNTEQAVYLLALVAVELVERCPGSRTAEPSAATDGVGT